MNPLRMRENKKRQKRDSIHCPLRFAGNGLSDCAVEIFSLELDEIIVLPRIRSNATLVLLKIKAFLVQNCLSKLSSHFFRH